jgi:dihydroxyacetone synthase
MAPSAIPVETIDQFPTKAAKSINGKLSSLQLKDIEQTNLVLRTFRCLIADLCEQFKGGHPG